MQVICITCKGGVWIFGKADSEALVEYIGISLSKGLAC